MSMIKFSLIIPCYRDETNLVCLLQQLQNMSKKAWEIIVIDGAESIACRQVCTAFKVRWVASKPCRGRQLFTGASVAKGDVLWFLHADARLYCDSFAAMLRAVGQGAIGGFFRFEFDRPREWPADILEPAIALRCRLGVPYGDQGIFIRRESYFAAGGHAPWPLFEEVPLVRGIRRLGKLAALREPIFVNPRRWRQNGWWRHTWNNRRLAMKFVCGITPEKLAAQYCARKIAKKSSDESG